LSPILVRPVREQLEHDRIIRQLQTRFRRRYEVGINPAGEQNVPVGTGATALYPDLVLSSPERGHRLQVVIEVETGESVNHLEALAQWAHFARTRAAFHLYVPAGMVDVARRLSEDNQIFIGEIWSYHSVGDEIRFTLVHRSREAPAALRSSRAHRPARPSPSRAVRAAGRHKAASRARPARAHKRERKTRRK